MSDDKKDTPPPAPGTVFIPTGGDPQPPAAEKTIKGEWRAPPPPEPAPPPEIGSLSPGTVLNSIYEVRRFIARGGMGEVYEGVNVNTDERVAIKVMLAHLATDPKVQAAFRKEAGALTQLAHPALVQYRLLALEPQLKLYYIVTEFIDGDPLSELLGQVRPTASELRALTRRLAQGLGAAHDLGIIHRDMAPDNVLLPHGRLDRAKIIDFGIAKDLDPSKETIVGDGFAGRLGYVAPEQFGDFGRTIGPWTDIYSLGLVVLALAAGRPSDMGVTLVEAVDRRRAGPNLSPLPATLVDVFKRMLAADPTQRFQSMDELIAALDELGTASTTPPTATTPPGPPPPKPPKAPKRPPFDPNVLLAPMRSAAAGLGIQARALMKRPGAPLYGALALAAALVLVIGLVVFKPGSHAPAPTSTVAAMPAAEGLRRGVEAAIPSADCAWLDIDSADQGAGGELAVRVSGAARDAAAASNAVARGATQAGFPNASIDTTGVTAATPAACVVLDALRSFRAQRPDSARGLASAQPVYEMSNQVDGCPGQRAKAIILLTPLDPARDFALFAVDGTGDMRRLAGSRADLARLGSQVSDMGDGRLRITPCLDRVGLQGLLMISGTGPFEFTLPSAGRTTFLDSFKRSAQARAWTTEMVWFRVANDQPDAPIAPVVTAEQAALDARKAAAAQRKLLKDQLQPAPVVTPTVRQPEPGPTIDPTPAEPAAGINACSRIDGGSNWTLIGNMGREACARALFSGRCPRVEADTIYGYWGNQSLRMRPGRVEFSKPGGRYNVLYRTSC
jgi:serine/threonine protein kinase